MDFFLKVLLAYLLGSVVGSLVVGRLRGGVDIRKLGSGNAGSTNALRTQGLAFGIWVIVIDVAKGWLAAALLPRLAHSRHRPPPRRRRPRGCRRCADSPPSSATCFPVWHGFRGGKGVATLVGAYAGLELAAARAAGGELAGGGHGVGLRRPVVDRRVAAPSRSIYCCATARVLTPLLGFALACAALVIYTHRGNVRRMRAGTEPRARKLWLFGRGRA